LRSSLSKFELETHCDRLNEYEPTIVPKRQTIMTDQFSDYSESIRKVIYATNTFESYHRNIQKMTKSKAAFTFDNALLKMAFCAIQNMDKIWQETAFN
jgi:Transposase, Mutator family